MPARYCPPVLGGRGRSPEGVKIIDYKKADTQKRVSANFLISQNLFYYNFCINRLLIICRNGNNVNPRVRQVYWRASLTSIY